MAKVAPGSGSETTVGKKISVDQRLEVDPNISISYADLGPRDTDDVVILLHGMLSTADNAWGSGTKPAYVCNALLNAGYRCILPEHRGHGSSSKPYDSSKYGVNIVNDLVKLLDHLNVAKVHLVGYSVGAEVSIYFTIHHQERVKSLCIGGSGWGDSHQVDVYKNMGKCCAPLPGMPCNINIVCWSRVVWYPCCCPLCCLCLGGFVPDMKAGVIFSKAHGEALIDLPEEKVKSIQVPMLGAAGTKDPETKYVKRMEGVVPNFEFVPLEGQDHDSAAMSPLWKETVLNFLEKQRGQGTKNGKDDAAQSAPRQEEMRAS